MGKTQGTYPHEGHLLKTVGAYPHAIQMHFGVYLLSGYCC